MPVTVIDILEAYSSSIPSAILSTHLTSWSMILLKTCWIASKTPLLKKSMHHLPCSTGYYAHGLFPRKVAMARHRSKYLATITSFASVLSVKKRHIA
jgi:hypothetical protein